MISFAVSEKALDSFKNEWGLEEDQYVRIYAKYAGGGSNAFTVGINASATPIDPAWVQSIGGFHFLLKKLMFGFYRMNFFKLIVMKTAYFQPKSPEHLLGYNVH